MSQTPDFGEPVDRHGTGSSKFNKYPSSVIPLWVADMDFRIAPPIAQVLHDRVDHGVFGYGDPADELVDVIQARLQKRYDWSVDPESIVFLPGLVAGLNVACRGLTQIDDAIVTATPVYRPFLELSENNQRRAVNVPCHYDGYRWRYPTEELVAAIESNAGGLFALCHPHNPIGRSLNPEELEPVLTACLANDVVLVSDEIHCDLVLDGRQHRPAVAMRPEIRQHAVTLMSASKTFNIAGVGGAFAIIEEPELRDVFKRTARGFMPDVHVMAYDAMLVALRDCGDWHSALLHYLAGNRDYLRSCIDDIHGITMNQVEATYLAWLDVSELRLDDPPGHFEAAGLGMSEGSQFGDDRFMRLNFSTQRSNLIEVVERLRRAVG
ncbi:MAG: aspartate aminotransferase [Gammaproteobacteria bacterium]|uniref:cysteine-S-conjugate beta-lyase n=1 Tax=OM182 bacterium MED-G24 TaxID=1986255 RepID=A0A2A5WS64_9GAMM|nr:aspartate aminotransferase [Gammaproteobacteria bacterium]PDH39241.1 MAG: aspartate aminotransferase [OM182 bacterium MED-G24]RPG25422.1 MAG: putative C-S lyase [Gammaproteobacteria bacterium TMED50]|tara:strand:- start:4577 stop:5716 length:1140 start_codon:yes stop_codon:yes gene_type:complete